MEAYVKGNHARAQKLIEQVCYPFVHKHDWIRTDGNTVKISLLTRQGKFFYQKAHEKDEESSKMIFGNRSESVLLYLRDTWVEGSGLTFLFLRFNPVCRDVEAHDVKLLNLHYHGAKEAIQLLKSDLSSFSGIPCMS